MRAFLPLLLRLLLLLPFALGTVAQPVLGALSHAHLLTTHGMDSPEEHGHAGLGEEHHDTGESLHFLTHHVHACGYAQLACLGTTLEFGAQPASERQIPAPDSDFVSARARALLRPPRTA